MNRLLFCIAGLFFIAASAHAADAPWPRFHGADGRGFSPATDVPVNPAAHIVWTVDVPSPGFSSPVIADGCVFLSGGDERVQEVMAFDLATGKLRWRTPVPLTTKMKVPDQCGMAAATVATDGTRVYAIFANGDLAAFDFGGACLWSKALGVPKNGYGHATSLITSGGHVIVQMDQGEAEENLSKLSAFDGATGKVVWQTARPVGASWSTPVALIDKQTPLIITQAVPWVIAYDARDGKEVWRAECLDGEITPSPLLVNHLVLAVSPSNKLQAIRTDGRGDVTATHLGWVAEDGIPDVTSPAANAELVFLLDSSGTVTCVDASSGTKLWSHDYKTECSASPVIGRDKLLIVTRKGTVIVLEAGRAFKELGRGELGEAVYATPAFSGSRTVIRGEKHLFCIDAASPRNP